MMKFEGEISRRNVKGVRFAYAFRFFSASFEQHKTEVSGKFLKRIHSLKVSSKAHSVRYPFLFFGFLIARMAGVVVYFAAFFVLMFGVLVGEGISLKAFGPQEKLIKIIDVVLFAISFAAMFFFADFGNSGQIYMLNFVAGLAIILIARSTEATIGMIDNVRSAEHVASVVIPTLIKAGVDSEDIKRMMQAMGIPQAKLEKLCARIDREVPAYLPKIIRLCDDVAEMKEHLYAMRKGGKKIKSRKAELQEPREEEPEKPEPKRDPFAGIRHIIQTAMERAAKEKTRDELVREDAAAEAMKTEKAAKKRKRRKPRKAKKRAAKKPAKKDVSAETTETEEPESASEQRFDSDL